MLTAIAALLIGYLLGSIPTGYWVAKAVAGIDIREHGSRSTGATNVLRCVGKGPALFVFLFDTGKGSAAVWICNYLEAAGFMTGMPFMELKLIPMAVALITLVGHSKSIFLNFQGGKSAATALGLAIAMNPAAAAESFATWLAVLGISRFVSLASIVAVISSSGWMMLNHAPIGYTAYCMLGAVYVVARHRANISRLLAGTEPRIGEKARQQPESSKQKV